MKSFLLKKRTRDTFKESIQVLKYSTRENYCACINKFKKFCSEKYHCTVEKIIDKISSKSDNELFKLISPWIRKDMQLLQ